MNDAGGPAQAPPRAYGSAARYGRIDGGALTGGAGFGGR